jgi:hypothetical protein
MEPAGNAVGEAAPLRRNPNFRRILASQLTSTSGSAIANVCLLWIVFTTTHSALDVGLYGAAGVTGGIGFSLIGGSLVDRYDRQRLMVTADLVRASAVGVLVVLLFLHGFTLLGIVAVAFFVAAFSMVFNPAANTLVLAIAGPSRLADANGLLGAAQSTAGFVATSVAGAFIVTVGALVGLGLNVVTFALSAMFVSSLVLPATARRPRPGASKAGGLLADLREGGRWLLASPGLFQLTVSAGFFNFFSALVGSFLVVYSTELLHGSAFVYAALLAAETAGAGAGTLLSGRIHAARKAGRWWVVGYGCIGGLAALGVALVPVAIVAIPLFFVMGCVGGCAVNAWLTAALLVVPPEIQGRYFGIDQLGSIAIIPVAQVGGGILIGVIGVGTTYLLAGVGWCLSGFAFLPLRSLARFGAVPGEVRPTPVATGGGTRP